MKFLGTVGRVTALTPLLLGANGLAAEPDFVHEIAPILRDNCLKCHQPGKKKAGLSFNDETSFREGSEDGPVVVRGNPDKSLMFERIISDDETERMPPKGDGLSANQVEAIRAWITAGAKWEPGFSFDKPVYEPPLKPRMPVLPAIADGRENPIDRLIDHYLAEKKLPRPKPLDDSAFLRRVHLDLTGLLPDPEEVTRFLADPSTDKRIKKIDALLEERVVFAEHWLTFWNDLLRNDYAGTGYIDGGRKDISNWLYRALVNNMPYDEFVRALVAPSPASEGFAAGIKWRGTVSAAQSTSMQYAQSVGQTFLGINLKCASCHDSFTDRWKLTDSYGLAAIYSDTPLEIYRCDKPTGKMAEPYWLFPELGKVDVTQPRPERLRQLAALITSPENGRTPRAISNRIWQRLMGRGIVHPVDAMQSAPWNEDLLDFLGSYLVENKYDLKQTMRLICLSQAYQAQAESLAEAPLESNYAYQGPRAKRLTAEEFTDAIWKICGTAPQKFDAPIQRAVAESGGVPALVPEWIWTDANQAAVGQVASFRRMIQFKEIPQTTFAWASADNSFELFVNGKKVLTGDNWEIPVTGDFSDAWVVGSNEIVMIVTNGGASPNPAGAIFHAVFIENGVHSELVSDGSWEACSGNPASAKWAPAHVMTPNPWGHATTALRTQLAACMSPPTMVRASLLKSDLLMRTLGRPNREQIVSTRPDDLATLEAMDLNNGSILDARLKQGADALLARNFPSSAALATHLWRSALCRDPSAVELEIIVSMLGEKPSAPAVQDLLWSILMMPEFQIIR